MLPSGRIATPKSACHGCAPLTVLPLIATLDTAAPAIKATTATALASARNALLRTPMELGDSPLLVRRSLTECGQSD